MLLCENLVSKIEVRLGESIAFQNRVSVDFRETSIVEKWSLKLISKKTKCIYIKKYRDDYYDDPSIICRKEFESAALYDGYFPASGCFHVVVPIFADLEVGVLVSEEAKGRDLFNITNSYLYRFFNRAILIKAYKESGRALKEFHKKTIGMEVFNYGELSSYINVRLEKLRSSVLTEFSEKDCNDIRNFFSDVGASLDGTLVSSASLHGDFVPPNMILDTDQLYLLDFSQFREGVVIDEICYFLVFCYFQGFKLNKRYWGLLGQEFLIGYGLEVNESNQKLIMLYFIKHLLNCLSRVSMWIEQSDSNSIKVIYLKWQYRKIKKLLLGICSVDNGLYLLDYRF